MKRSLVTIACACFTGCLDFSECPACVDAGAAVDAGTKCPTNLIRVGFAAQVGVQCSVLDAGLKGGGQTSSGTCAPLDGGSWGVTSSFSRPAPLFADAGPYICAHMKASALPPTATAIAMHCGPCDAGAPCGCANQSSCIVGVWADAGDNSSGPFLLPPSCSTVDVTFAVANDPTGSGFSFQQGWAWQVDTGEACVWDSEADCPAP